MGIRLRPGCGPSLLHNAFRTASGLGSHLPSPSGCTEPCDAARGCGRLPPEVRRWGWGGGREVTLEWHPAGELRGAGPKAERFPWRWPSLRITFGGCDQSLKAGEHRGGGAGRWRPFSWGRFCAGPQGKLSWKLEIKERFGWYPMVSLEVKGPACLFQPRLS